MGRSDGRKSAKALCPRLVCVVCMLSSICRLDTRTHDIFFLKVFHEAPREPVDLLLSCLVYWQLKVRVLQCIFNAL